MVVIRFKSSVRKESNVWKGAMRCLEWSENYFERRKEMENIKSIIIFKEQKEYSSHININRTQWNMPSSFQRHFIFCLSIIMRLIPTELSTLELERFRKPGLISLNILPVRGKRWAVDATYKSCEWVMKKIKGSEMMRTVFDLLQMDGQVNVQEYVKKYMKVWKNITLPSK